MASTELLIFVVDDEPTIIENLQHALEDAGYAVSSASNGEDAMIFVESKAHDSEA